MPTTQCLITGGAGFIGSHLTERLLAAGDFVTVIDNESTGSVENLRSVFGHPRFRYLQGDVADATLLASLVAEADEIYHLAAAVGVQLVSQDPVQTLATNLQPTELLLRLARARHARRPPLRFFLASSSEVYGKNPKESWTEDDDLVFGPTSRLRWSYGASKAIDEFLALASHRQHGLPVVIARFFNVVGPRQVGRYGMVLPRFVNAALAGQPLLIHDDGRQTRCFSHVDDVVRACVGLLRTPAAEGLVCNVGSDEPISIRDLAELVCELSGSRSAREFQTYQAAYGADFEDVRHRVPDLTRLRALLGFRPDFDLRATIADVIRAARDAQGART